MVAAESIQLQSALDFRGLYAELYPCFFRFGLAFSGSETRAAEAVQQAFLDLIRNPGSFDPARGSAAALLYGMVRNRLRSARRAEREEPLEDDSAFEDELLLVKHSDPRMGETATRLSNVRLGEPSKSLFEPPTDYTISENPRVRMLLPAMRVNEER